MKVTLPAQIYPPRVQIVELSHQCLGIPQPLGLCGLIGGAGG